MTSTSPSRHYNNQNTKTLDRKSSSKMANPKPKKEMARWKDLPHKPQLSILVMARLVEPLVQTSLQAYMFYQLQSFDLALSDSTVAWQAGILQASFSFGQTLTGWMWGRAADTYGRKTTLLFGSFGTLVSCLGFGFSHSFAAALVFRLLGGLVNGNIPVMRTMLAEIVGEKKHQARAFLLFPMCYNIGVIIGPVMGGVLANPVDTYPSLFGPESTLGGSKGVSWMSTWPYLAPNLASAFLVALNAALIACFLQETLPAAQGRSILRTVRQLVDRITGRRRPISADYAPVPDTEQAIPLVSPTDSTASTLQGEEEEDKDDELRKSPPKLPFRRIWTPNVLFTLLAHFATAFHLGTFNSLWFIFLSAARYDPKSEANGDYHPHGPFVFTGGLNLPPVQVGTAMSILGIIGITLQILIYPRANDKYGVLPLYRTFVYGFPLAYLLAPYLAILPSTSPPPSPPNGALVWIGLCIVLFFFVVSRTFVLPATMILINNCSPHPSVLGTVHGVAQSVGSAARTLGPGVAGYLFSVGLRVGVVGLPWWALAGLGAFAVFTSIFVREGSGHEILLEGETREQGQQSGR
jgi:MFS family permease